MKHKLHVEVELDDEFLKDVLITALEGGIGYWSACSEYKPDAGYAVIHELNDDWRAVIGGLVVARSAITPPLPLWFRQPFSAERPMPSRTMPRLLYRCRLSTWEDSRTG